MKLLEFIGYYAIARCIYEIVRAIVLALLGLDEG